MAEFKRARNPKAKEIRKQSILDAATTLFKNDPSNLPTTSQISKHCDISKGALYLYFKTKEEIFLAIVEEHLLEWLDIFDIQPLLQSRQTLDDKLLITIIEKSCTHISSNPTFMQLASMSSSVIEPNVDNKMLLEHKNRIGNKITKISQDIADNLKPVTSGQASALILRSYAMLLGLWQVCSPESLVRAKATSLSPLTPEFDSTAREMVKQMWREEVEPQRTERGGIFGRLFSGNNAWSS